MAAPLVRRGRESCRNVSSICRYCRRLKHSDPWAKTVALADGFEVPIGEKSLQFETGKLARFADGAAMVRYGDTSVLVTAVSQKNASSSSFLPLTVDFRQKAAAAGRIPTNFLRRELGPSEKEILTSRVIDRSVRPLFPPNFNYSTQVMCNLLAVDGVNDPDIVSINAASAALAVSDIPWNGPVGAVRVGVLDGKVVLNPTRKQLQHSSLNVVVTGSKDEKIVMLEGDADRLSIPRVQEALSEGVNATQNIINTISQLQTAVGKEKRSLDPPKTPPQHIVDAIQSFASVKVRDILYNDAHDKISRDQAIRAAGEQVTAEIKANYPDEEDGVIMSCYHAFVKQTFRSLILDEERRCDGRSLDSLRHISCQVDLYKPLHGSALFQRGQTQGPVNSVGEPWPVEPAVPALMSVSANDSRFFTSPPSLPIIEWVAESLKTSRELVLCTVTFDSLESAVKSDPVSVITGSMKEKNFMLHYEFPPYATNETGRGGIGRRELGHGALAERGLKAILPESSDFTTRLTSEVLESNGSSSMASVCGGSLALMDAGVAVKEPAAGVAIGLMSRLSEETGEMTHHKILTDLLGIEDYMGDMDFKMAATASGLTAIQADIKLPGIPFFVVTQALEKGFDATQKILGIMEKTIANPRSSKKASGPVTEKVTLDHSKGGKLTGFGGYNLRKLKSETGVTVTRVDENNFQIFAPNADAMTDAKEMMETIFEDQKEPVLEFGAIYTGKIVEMRDIGVMLELHPKLKPVLLHNSQLDHRKVSHASALGFEVGQDIQIKYFGRDPSSGQHRISRKVLQAPGVPLIRNLNPKR